MSIIKDEQAMIHLYYDVKKGEVSQPQIKHDNSADYGLTEKEVVNIKLRYLRHLKKLSTASLLSAKSLALRHYNWHSQWQLYERQKELDKINLRIRYQLDRLQFIKNQEKYPSQHIKKSYQQPQYDIEQIKKVPCNLITDIAPSGFFIHNPFRNERSPSNSLHWNKTTNRWTDYGSGEHGDNLDLYMKINDCDLPTALRNLANMG